MRKGWFILLTLIAASACLALNAKAMMPSYRPEILFLLAFWSAVSVRSGGVVAAFWWCGLLADLFTGNKLGAMTLLYTLSGILVGSLKFRFRDDHMIARMLVSGLLLFVVLMVKPIVEQRQWVPFSVEMLIGVLKIVGVSVAVYIPGEWITHWFLGESRQEDE